MSGLSGMKPINAMPYGVAKDLFIGGYDLSPWNTNSAITTGVLAGGTESIPPEGSVVNTAVETDQSAVDQFADAIPPEGDWAKLTDHGTGTHVLGSSPMFAPIGMLILPLMSFITGDGKRRLVDETDIVSGFLSVKSILSAITHPVSTLAGLLYIGLDEPLCSLLRLHRWKLKAYDAAIARFRKAGNLNVYAYLNVQKAMYLANPAIKMGNKMKHVEEAFNEALISYVGLGDEENVRNVEYLIYQASQRFTTVQSVTKQLYDLRALYNVDGRTITNIATSIVSAWNSKNPDEIISYGDIPQFGHVPLDFIIRILRAYGMTDVVTTLQNDPDALKAEPIVIDKTMVAHWLYTYETKFTELDPKDRKLMIVESVDQVRMALADPGFRKRYVQDGQVIYSGMAEILGKKYQPRAITAGDAPKNTGPIDDRAFLIRVINTGYGGHIAPAIDILLKEVKAEIEKENFPKEFFSHEKRMIQVEGIQLALKQVLKRICIGMDSPFIISVLTEEYPDKIPEEVEPFIDKIKGVMASDEFPSQFVKGKKTRVYLREGVVWAIRKVLNME